MIRAARHFLFASVLFGSTACVKEADPAPVVGGLELTLTYPTAYAGLRYYLYTENGYVSTRQVGPLRQERISTLIVINDLNPGNYVFTLMNIEPRSVQVTAGRTTKFTFTY